MQVLIHILNEETILGDIESLPEQSDNILIVKNPRKRDGKELSMLQEGVEQVFWPMSRIAYVEVLPGDEEEHIIGFVRD